jgi:hypothetical protein
MNIALALVKNSFETLLATIDFSAPQITYKPTFPYMP